MIQITKISWLNSIFYENHYIFEDAKVREIEKDEYRGLFLK